MNAKYLTQSEIESIEQLVNNYPLLRHPNICTGMRCGSERNTIIKVTPKHGLILITGDEHTGFQHILDRHMFSSTKQYWKSEEIIDDPSRFEKGTIPITAFVKISDVVFETKRNDLNKNTSLFDVYQSEVFLESGVSKEYRLITYKNSKIINTLFPTKGIKKKIINLRRGNCRGKETNEFRTISVPYRNSKGEAVFSFQVITDFKSKVETWYLINHFSNMHLVLEEKQAKILRNLEEEINCLNEDPLIWVEQEIKEWISEDKK